MNSILSSLRPSATEMIRADHARVMTAFHRYSLDAPAALKRAVVGSVCLALEIHAQLEDELFYPEMRAVGATQVEQLATEHERMRTLIAALRGVEPASGQYDNLFMDLMHEVIHHVAEEETRVLPEAERLLGPRLGEIGMRMTKRRLELMRPRAGELVKNSVASMPKAGMAAGAAIAVIAGALLLRGMKRG